MVLSAAWPTAIREAWRPEDEKDCCCIVGEVVWGEVEGSIIEMGSE